MHLSDEIRMYINMAVGILFVLLTFSLEQNNITFLYGQYETVMASYLMYVMGIYCGRKHVETSTKNEIVIMISAFIMLNLCNNVCYMLGWNCSVNQMRNPYMFLLTSTLGIICFYYMARILNKISYARTVAAWLGRNSLFILLFQFVAFKIVNLIQCVVYSQPFYRIASFPVLESGNMWWFVYTIVALIVPALFGSGYLSLKEKIVNNKIGDYHG